MLLIHLEWVGSLKIVDRAAGITKLSMQQCQLLCLWHELMLCYLPLVFIKKHHFPFCCRDGLIFSASEDVLVGCLGRGFWVAENDTSITDWCGSTFCNMVLWALLSDFLQRVSSSLSLGIYLDCCFGIEKSSLLVLRSDSWQILSLKCLQVLCFQFVSITVTGS